MLPQSQLHLVLVLILLHSDTAGALTIDLGAGNDTIICAAAAIDTITVGAGNDDIISNDFDNIDVIKDLPSVQIPTALICRFLKQLTKSVHTPRLLT